MTEILKKRVAKGMYIMPMKQEIIGENHVYIMEGETIGLKFFNEGGEDRGIRSQSFVYLRDFTL